MTSSSKISEIPLLSGEECNTIIANLFDLQCYWERQNQDKPRFMLGAARYYTDAPDYHPAVYRSTVNAMNPILWKHFHWLYDRLLDTLAAHLGQPVHYRKDLALPGFNIFLEDKDFADVPRNIHYDQQYLMLNWDPIEEADFTSTFSVTLPIALPKSGGGLNIWDLHRDEVIGLSKQQVEEAISKAKQSYFPYKVGYLVKQSGHYFHQIASMKDVEPDDKRITLQAHALFHSGMWVLYR